MLQDVDHPNIIKLIDNQPEEVTGTLVFTTELMTGTLLDSFKMGFIPSDQIFIEWIL